MSFKTWGNIMFKNYIREEAGASAAEYALILAIVGAGIALAASTLGGSIQSAIATPTPKLRSTLRNFFPWHVGPALPGGANSYRSSGGRAPCKVETY